MGSAVKDVQSKEELDGILKEGAGLPAILHFWAEWCEASKQMDRVFSHLCTDTPHAKFLRVEAEQQPEISEAFSISAVPYFVFFKDGKVVDTLEGANPSELANKVSKVSGSLNNVSSAAPASLGMAAGPAVIEAVKEINKSPQVGSITARPDTALKSRLQQLVYSKPVLLFMKGTPDQPQCGFSRKVVDVLKDVGVEFGSFDILSDQEVREGMKVFSNWRRHPYEDCYILVIIGLAKQVHLPSLKATLQSTLLKHKRFSSIVKGCTNGNQKWVQQQDVDIDEHVIVPNLSASYTQGLHFVEEYTASLATAPPLNPSRPLWQIHVLNYKSAEAEANVVFKIHHCIGDCVSLMSLFLDSTRKHSQPESMPTIPSTNRASKNKLPLWYPRGILQAMWSAVFSLWSTVLELLYALATFLWLKDSKILRSPPEVVDYPKRLAHVTLDLQDIAMVKKAVNGTMNDVITGMLSAGFVQYFNRLHAKDRSRSKKASDLRIRALVPVNTRSSPGLHPLEYMMNKNQRDARWGNGFSLWTLPIPLDTHEHFLDYCRKAKSRLNRKKASFEAPFTFILTSLLARIFGINLAIYLPYRQALNTTLVFSNVQGPVEQVQLIQDNLVTHIITTVSRVPQSLVVHFQSYAEKAELAAMAAEDVFPNPRQLCMDWAYALHRMKEEALALPALGGEL